MVRKKGEKQIEYEEEKKKEEENGLRAKPEAEVM
jgi:hypothetical protein